MPATVAAYVAQVRPAFRATRAFVRKHAPEPRERVSMGVPSPWGSGALLHLDRAG